MAARDADNYGAMVVCGECGEPKGPVTLHAYPGAEQLCQCTPLEERRAQPSWGRDFNRVVELCHCCGLVAISSGSRWSVLLCQRCLSRVRALNELAGRCVVAIGRHSLMNGVSTPGRSARSGPALVAFADQLGAFLGQMVQLDQWGRDVVLANLVALGHRPGEDVLLDAYLAHCRRTRKLSSKMAFRSLVCNMTSEAEGRTDEPRVADLLSAVEAVIGLV